MEGCFAFGPWGRRCASRRLFAATVNRRGAYERCRTMSLVSRRSHQVIGRISAGQLFEPFQEIEPADAWSMFGPADEISVFAGKGENELLVYRAGQVVGVIRAIDPASRHAVAIVRKNCIERLVGEQMTEHRAVRLAESINDQPILPDDGWAVAVPQPIADATVTPRLKSRSA